MEFGDQKITRAEFEENLFHKRTNKVFTGDILPLLSADQAEHYNFGDAISEVETEFIARLPGEPWKKKK